MRSTIVDRKVDHSLERLVAQAGTGFLGNLALAFIVIRLCDVIQWSWWWVTAPLWGVPALVLVVVILLCTGGAISVLILSIVAVASKFIARRRSRKLERSKS